MKNRIIRMLLGAVQLIVFTFAQLPIANMLDDLNEWNALVANIGILGAFCAFCTAVAAFLFTYQKIWELYPEEN